MLRRRLRRRQTIQGTFRRVRVSQLGFDRAAKVFGLHPVKNRSRTPTPFHLLSIGRRVSALSDFLQARSHNVSTSCDAATPCDQDATDRRLLPITSIHKHPCLANSTVFCLRFVRVGPWHFTMPRSRRRITWCVGGVVFPCRFLLRPTTIEPLTHLSPALFAKCGWSSSTPASSRARPLVSPPREKRRAPTIRRVFLLSGSATPIPRT